MAQQKETVSVPDPLDDNNITCTGSQTLPNNPATPQSASAHGAPPSSLTAPSDALDQAGKAATRTVLKAVDGVASAAQHTLNKPVETVEEAGAKVLDAVVSGVATAADVVKTVVTAPLHAVGALGSAVTQSEAEHGDGHAAGLLDQHPLGKGISRNPTFAILGSPSTTDRSDKAEASRVAQAEQQEAAEDKEQWRKARELFSQERDIQPGQLELDALQLPPHHHRHAAAGDGGSSGSSRADLRRTDPYQYLTIRKQPTGGSSGGHHTAQGSSSGLQFAGGSDGISEGHNGVTSSLSNGTAGRESNRGGEDGGGGYERLEVTAQAEAQRGDAVRWQAMSGAQFQPTPHGSDFAQRVSKL